MPVDVNPWAFSPHPEVWLLVGFLAASYVYMVRVIGPKAVRASMGALFTQKIAAVPWPNFIAWLRSGEGQLVGTSLRTLQTIAIPGLSSSSTIRVPVFSGMPNANGRPATGVSGSFVTSTKRLSGAGAAVRVNAAGRVCSVRSVRPTCSRWVWTMAFAPLAPVRIVVRTARGRTYVATGQGGAMSADARIEVEAVGKRQRALRRRPASRAGRARTRAAGRSGRWTPRRR